MALHTAKLTRKLAKKQAKLKRKQQKEIESGALRLLESPEVFSRYVDMMRRMGVVGEELACLVICISGVSRLLKRPLNLLVKALSSAGKNLVVGMALRPFPKDAVRELTSSSALAWNYAEDDFRHRIVYVQERNEASGAVHPARLLISENKLVRIVTVMEHGRRVARRYVTRGPIAAISTTTKNQLEIDDESRHVSIWLDQSREQTRRIIRAHATEAPGISKRELETWRAAHRMLERLSNAQIKLPPWFKRIADWVYDGDLRVRRYFPAFVTACKAVALFRGFQKPILEDDKGQRTLVVDFADLAIATILFGPVFVGSLYHGTDENFETRAVVERISERLGGPVRGLDLARELSISSDIGYARLRRAREAGLIRRVNKANKSNIKLYLPAAKLDFIPPPEKLFQDIPELGEREEFVHPLTGEKIVFRRRMHSKAD